MRQGLSKPELYGDLVYKSKKIVGISLSVQFIKIISHYTCKKIGYNIIDRELLMNPTGEFCTLCFSKTTLYKKHNDTCLSSGSGDDVTV